MLIIIKSSSVQFKNPVIGQPTRAVEEHYNGRIITAIIDGEDRMFRIKKEELAFLCTEEDMILAIEKKLNK
ncbi:hypothetical protein [Clostridium sp. UBA2485]|uniref:hypothetical protein n=1 Tax=Clostridium sp. UBA2485 TaxID=1946352 RepID=UPI0025BE66FC|nr:hypothetical protein [Clostridium sp. UBA2485]